MERRLEADPAAEALFIGGRSGVGKTSVGNEIHGQLSRAGVPHCLIDGDSLDMAFPEPWDMDQGAPDWVHRVDTDARSVADIATQVIELVGWRQ